jgi:hypothetical protein
MNIIQLPPKTITKNNRRYIVLTEFYMKINSKSNYMRETAVSKQLKQECRLSLILCDTDSEEQNNRMDETKSL